MTIFCKVGVWKRETEGPYWKINSVGVWRSLCKLVLESDVTLELKIVTFRNMLL